MQQLVEEMAELTAAICRYAGTRGEGDVQEAAEENLIEELADVRLVLGQVIYLHKCEGSVGEALNQDRRKDQKTDGLEEAAQMQKLVEKMAELTKAICKYARIHGQSSLSERELHWKLSRRILLKSLQAFSSSSNR